MRRQHRQRSHNCGQRGFTLVELVVVVLVLGIIGSVAAPRMASWTDDARIETTVTTVQAAQRAAQYFHAKNGYWPDDVNNGQMPPELEPYLRSNVFENDVPIGGVYDWNNGYGATAAMFIRDNNYDADVWLAIDQKYDDGNLATGSIRKHGSRHLNFILED